MGPFKRTKNTALVQPTLPAPLVIRKPGPISRGAPLPSQQHPFIQTQECRRIGADGRSQVYHLTSEEAEASDEVVARCGGQHPKQEP